MGTLEETVSPHEDMLADMEVRYEEAIPRMWAHWWLPLKGILFPPTRGYQRVPYICVSLLPLSSQKTSNLTCSQSCGEFAYLDVRELSPGGIERFRRRISAFGIWMRSPGESPTMFLRPPRQALLAPATDVAFQSGNSTHPEAQLSEPPQLADHNRTRHAATQPRDSDPQYLLLCVNTKSSTSLAHIDVRSFTSDQYLFQEIRESYRRIREENEWKISMIIPK